MLSTQYSFSYIAELVYTRTKSPIKLLQYWFDLVSTPFLGPVHSFERTFEKKSPVVFTLEWVLYIKDNIHINRKEEKQDLASLKQDPVKLLFELVNVSDILTSTKQLENMEIKASVVSVHFLPYLSYGQELSSYRPISDHHCKSS